MWKRSEGWRWLAWLLNLLCLSVVVLEIIFIFPRYLTTNRKIGLGDIIDGKPYRESYYFQSLVEKQVNQIMEDIYQGMVGEKADESFQNVVYNIEIDGNRYTNGSSERIDTWRENYENMMLTQTLDNVSIQGLMGELTPSGGMYQLIYFYGDNISNLYQSNLQASMSWLTQFCQERGGTVRIYFFLDPSFQSDDSYAQLRREYHQMQGILPAAIGVGVTAVIGFLWSFIYLLSSAGRKKNSEEIYLTAVDKMPTEIYLSLYGAVIILLFECMTLRLTGTYLEIAVQIVVFAVAAYLLFLAFLQRFIKRRKAGVSYWQTSLVRKMVKGVEKMYESRKASSRTTFLALVGVILFLIAEPFGIGMLLFLLWYILVVFWLLKKAVWRNQIQEGVEKIASGDIQYQIDTTDMKTDELELAERINQLGGGLQQAVDEATKNERLKSELITNVSHDIKTPLTSIINYVDLIKRENVENEKVNEYIHVLDEKSQRLKHLTEDLVEASKANTGNLVLEMENLDLIQLIHQTLGEFEDKFEEQNLQIVSKLNPGPIYIYADGRRIWRVMENLLQNVYKYAMPNTRVYVDTWVRDQKIAVTIKNISKNPLNIPAEELTERFIRGDVARTTEGSGLGLSIAKTMTELMEGEFSLYLDGDLFRVSVIFDQVDFDKTQEVDPEGEQKGASEEGVAEKKSKRKRWKIHSKKQN